MNRNRLILIPIILLVLGIGFVTGRYLLSGARSCWGATGPDINREISVESFDSLDIGGEAEVFIQQGNTIALSIKAPEKVIDNLEINVKGKTLDIESDLCPRKFAVYVTMADIKSLKFSGSAKVVSNNELKAKDLEISNSGSAEMKLAASAEHIKFESSGSSTTDLALKTETLEVKNSGSSEQKLSGSANSVILANSGSSELDALNMQVKTYKIDSSGSSDLKINVEEKLDLDMSGSGSVEYKGQPKITTSGSGSINLKAIQP